MINRSLGVFSAGIVLICAGLGCQVAQADPAVVIDEFGCTGFVPDNGTSLFTTESHAVLTRSGVNILTCHFNHAVVLPHATGAQGFLCGTVFGLTSDTKMLATPGGKATLVCKINGQDK
jgi:hypothetical protein